MAFALAALAASGGAAHADGDPASDWLLTQPVFVPFDAPSPALKAELIATAKAAKARGYPVRVAVIQAPTDLGAIPQLLGKPSIYARFLGAELRFAYRGRLLVVMQDGYGFTENGKPEPQGMKALANLPKPAGNTPDDLTRSAITALHTVAAAAGHPLPKHIAVVEPGSASGGTSFVSAHRTAIVAGAVVIVALLAAGGVLAFAATRNA